VSDRCFTTFDHHTSTKRHYGSILLCILFLNFFGGGQFNKIVYVRWSKWEIVV